MSLYISMEKEYLDGTWCRKILQGISHESLKKKISPIFIEIEDLNTLKLKEQENHIILVGSSIYWTSNTLELLGKIGITPILITCQPFSTMFDISCSIPDYQTATAALVSYMSENQRDRIALFGINPDSTSDVQKAASFKEIREHMSYSTPDANIFYNFGSMANCYSEFNKKIDHYNAVLCANDFAAITMIENLKTGGYKVPEDFFVASFTDTMIGRMYSPAITSVSLNFYDLGRQAVVNYSLLSKQHNISSIKILAKYELNIRETTMNIPPKSHIEDRFPLEDHRIDFYSDHSISNLITVENLLNTCDDVDRNILYGILTKEVYRDISLRCFISEETVKYRIRKFLNLCRLSSKKDLQELLLGYISPDSLLKE